MSLRSADSSRQITEGSDQPKIRAQKRPVKRAATESAKGDLEDDFAKRPAAVRARPLGGKLVASGELRDADVAAALAQDPDDE